MRFRHAAAWVLAVSLIGLGATFLRAQQVKPESGDSPSSGRAKLRAEIIRLRTDVERLDLDYQLARENFRGLVGMCVKECEAARVDAIKIFELVGGLDWSVSPKNRKDSKSTSEVAKDQELEATGEPAILEAMKKELARHFAVLAERRLDLEDAERRYRETSR